MEIKFTKLDQKFKKKLFLWALPHFDSLTLKRSKCHQMDCHVCLTKFYKEHIENGIIKGVGLVRVNIGLIISRFLKAWTQFKIQGFHETKLIAFSKSTAILSN